MTDFQRDFEVILNNTDVINNGNIRFVMKHRSRIDSEPIATLELKQRSENVLLRNGVKTVKQLFDNLYRLKGMRGSGANTVKNVNTTLMSYYYDQLDDEEKKEFWRDTVEATIEMALGRYKYER